ncbi:MAG: glutathione S-transferase [Candidatus Cloacimonadota bacterium]|nr:MAG: glutathione S-transferase [Candidatus Cloacimonadota bacterium]PCJ21037.1 MAG: glutathione S-transferase [Candidatus Cloacimonadota bacterium]
MELIGIRISPFVRKVRLVLAEKKLDYTIKDWAPFSLPDNYKEDYHPMGKIPLLVDGDLKLPDSSAICTYLEAKYPEISIFPKKPEALGTALWFEEYADTQIATNLTFAIFFERVVKPKYLDTPTDQKVVDNAIENEIPPMFDYLNSALEKSKFLAGDDYSIADFSICTHFVNVGYANYFIDKERWPKLAEYFERVKTIPSFKEILEDEIKFLAENN